MTVGETCTPVRESKHEVHPATTTIMEHPLPRVGEVMDVDRGKARIQGKPIKR